MIKHALLVVVAGTAGCHSSGAEVGGSTSVAEGLSSSATAGTADVTGEPTGDPSTVGTGAMSMSGSESETAETNSTGVVCVDSSECADPKSPVCVDSVCVSCTEAGFPDQACEAKDPAAPVCRGDGECVACTPTNPSACDGTTPVCDEASSACVGCSFHEQCPESACRIATGGCFDAGNVHDVGQGMEYEGIGDAVADLGPAGEVVLRIFDGPTYNEAVTIGGAAGAYALLAHDAAMVPLWANTMEEAPTLRVDSGAEVYVQSLRFAANGVATFPGISVSAATLYLDRTEVLGNAGGGLLLTGTASGFVRNCLLGGGPASDNPAVSVDNAAVAILYSTLVGYDDGFGAGAALRCSNPDSVEARNSLFVKTGSGADLDCPELAATYSATENALAGVGNVALGSVMANWFVGITTDLHLNSPPAALLSAAEWRVGDPPVDIDGEPRPAEDATPDVAGADLP